MSELGLETQFIVVLTPRLSGLEISASLKVSEDVDYRSGRNSNDARQLINGDVRVFANRKHHVAVMRQKGPLAQKELLVRSFES